MTTLDLDTLVLDANSHDPGSDREVEHALQLAIPVFFTGGDVMVWRSAVEMRLRGEL